MDDYNFWRDFFDTYQSLSDWLKTLWLIVPPLFLLALIWLWRRPSLPLEATASDEQGRLIYSVYRDGDNRTHIISHCPELQSRSSVLMLDLPETGHPGHQGALAITARQADGSEGS